MQSAQGGFEARSQGNIAAGHGAGMWGSLHGGGMRPKRIPGERKGGEIACRKDLPERKSDSFLPVSNLIWFSFKWVKVKCKAKGRKAKVAPKKAKLRLGVRKYEKQRAAVGLERY